MLSRFFLFFLVLLAGLARADAAAERQLAAELLALTGTAAVFASPRVQAALSDPMPFLGAVAVPRREHLLNEVGFRPWQPPRVWVLQARKEGTVEHWDNLAPLLQAAAQRRGYALVNAIPLPSAEEAIHFLTPDKAHPGLRGLLAAYDADVLVLVRAQQWLLWHPDYMRQGGLPGRSMELLPDMLAEVMAAEQQWPEAHGHTVVQINGVSTLADFAAVQTALQALAGAQQVQLIRAGRDSVWFTLGAPVAEALTAALDAEPRLLPTRRMLPALSSPASRICRLACRLQMRQWQADALTKMPAVPSSSVQSAPSP